VSGRYIQIIFSLSPNNFHRLLQSMGTNKGGFRTINWDLATGYKPIQWRSTVAAPSCASCNKAVFPAEEVNGAGQKFHKLCLKCSKSSSLFSLVID
jgi:hypothetical protein